MTSLTKTQFPNLVPGGMLFFGLKSDFHHKISSISDLGSIVDSGLSQGVKSLVGVFRGLA
jgi:hypothetical protein